MGPSTSSWSGQASFSQDGRQLAFATVDWRTTLLRVGFDPVREETIGVPTPILESTRTIRDHQLSPDGEWVAINHAGVKEDILLARVDGSQYRRLTDDDFRDRGPSWTPDGERIGFYSDRSGGYEIWTIRPDGSGLEQVTHDSPVSMNFPVWAPDGSSFASATIPGSWLMFRGGAITGEEMPRPGDSKFWPLSWSPDGRRLAGSFVGDHGSIEGVATYAFETGEYRTKELEPTLQWIAPTWLSDSRRLLVRDTRGIRLLDADTWRSKELIEVGGYMIGRSVGISRDDRWITYTRTATEGDVWVMTLER